MKQLVKERTTLALRSFIESLKINYDSYNGQKRYNNLPRADEAYKIAQALNTTVEWLITGKERNQTTSHTCCCLDACWWSIKTLSGKT
ncbi:MAG: hypothetical protein ACTTJ7_03795 [Treponema sp.]